MADILINQLEEFPEALFEVKVIADTTTAHKVLVKHDYYQKLTSGNIPPADLIRKSFEFLLEKEPNTSILPEFKLSVIKNFYPEFEELFIT